MKSKFTVLAFIGFLIFFNACSSSESSKISLNFSTEDPPNIIWIMADDLGYGDLGSYGQELIRTPRLDQMAQEGLRFTQFYAGHTVCAPTRSSLMTGRHTGHTRVRGNFSAATGDRVPLEPGDTTVAEILQNAGYKTGLIGKWGLGEPETTGIPNRKGFGYFYGFLNQARAHRYYPEWVWENREQVILEGNQDGRREQYIHDLQMDRAYDFISDSADDSFFLYLALQIPHAELLVPEDALEDYLDEDGNSIFEETPFPDGRHYSPQSMPNATYAAMVSRMDRDVGRLLDLLKELEINENTIVFFTSDNGPHAEGGNDPEYFNSNGPLRGIKRDLYEGGIRVPMIVWMPGTVPSGEVSDQVWTMWDFLPTVSELAGSGSPAGIDGISMVNALLNKPVGEERPLYWEFHGSEFKQAVRLNNWKAVRNGVDQPIELYDLSMDIGETNNLSEQHPDLIAHVDSLFKSARTANKHFPVGELD